MQSDNEIVEHLHHLSVISGKAMWRSCCSCGANWTHPIERTQEEIMLIFESHKAYFNKPKLETL